MSTAENVKQQIESGGDEALAPGTTLLNAQYRIESYLSAGGFGITYLARDSLNRSVVIKECFPEAVCSRVQKTVCARTRAHQGDLKSFVALFVREARSLSKLKHPNVVGVHQVFEDNETAYMALDLIEGQDLLSVIDSGRHTLSPSKVIGILLQVLDAIALMHEQDILHRDISPDNILINDAGAPVLIDFGAAREEASKKSRALSSVLVVKDGYSPQEFYFGGSKQGPFSDIYALGATFYHLISGEAPPNSQNRLAEIAANQPDPCVPLAGRFADYPMALLASVDKAMSVFPKNRIQSAGDWIKWIQDSTPIQNSKSRARENENRIKALMATTPQVTRDSLQSDCSTRQSTFTATAKPNVYKVDFSDLRETGAFGNAHHKNPSQDSENKNSNLGSQKQVWLHRLIAPVGLLAAVYFLFLIAPVSPFTMADQGYSHPIYQLFHSYR